MPRSARERPSGRQIFWTRHSIGEKGNFKHAPYVSVRPYIPRPNVQLIEARSIVEHLAERYDS